MVARNRTVSDSQGGGGSNSLHDEDNDANDDYRSDDSVSEHLGAPRTVISTRMAKTVEAAKSKLTPSRGIQA